MSQASITASLDNDTSGPTLITLLEGLEAALLTKHSGTSRPSYAVAGTLWLDTTATPWVIKMFDGTDDIPFGYVDATADRFTPGLFFKKGTDIVSVATVDLAAATGNYVDITGTTTITALGTLPAGMVYYLQFDAALTITHNATSLILPGALNILTAAGDVAIVVSEGSGNWRCINYRRNNKTINLAEGSAAAPAITFVDADSGLFQPTGTASIGISANGVETLRSTSTHLMIGKTTADSGATVGGEFYKTGFNAITASGNHPLEINRLASDGLLIQLKQDGVAEGNITVSGTTVTFTTFCGSHESQLAIEAQRHQLVPGTVMETADELSDWYGRAEHLPKCKISDTPGSRNVYGVFFDWFDSKPDDDTLNVASLGAFRIRINGNEKVNAGDLLVSAGNGCAKVQSDDLMRSSTIAKVIATTKLEIYEDGSYLVPCTLHCG